MALIRFQHIGDERQRLGLDPLRRNGVRADRSCAVPVPRHHATLRRRRLDLALHHDAAFGIVLEHQRRSEAAARRERQRNARVGIRTVGVLPRGCLMTGVLELGHERVQDRTHHLAESLGSGLSLAIAAAAGPGPRRSGLLVLGIRLEQGTQPSEDLVAHRLSPYTPQTPRKTSLISPSVARARTAATIGSMSGAAPPSA